MAAVKKFDRCGKYYDKNTEHKQNINGRLYYEDGMCFTTVAEEYGYVKDLCDDCLDKLHIFLNGAELIMEDGKKMINFNPRTVYVYNQDGTSIGRLDTNDCSIECECEDEINYISNDINNTIKASFEVAGRMFEEALFYISGARDVVIKCCPNRKVVYLATHSKKRRTRKKNIHRAIKILEEIAND